MDKIIALLFIFLQGLFVFSGQENLIRWSLFFGATGIIINHKDEILKYFRSLFE